MGCGLSIELAELEKAPLGKIDTEHSQQKGSKKDHGVPSAGSDEVLNVIQDQNRHNYFSEPGFALDETFKLDVEDDHYMLDEDDDIDQDVVKFETAWQEQLKVTQNRKHNERGKCAAEEARKALAKKYKSHDPFWNAFNLLHGNPYIETRSDVKVVRIFTSSTFTDTSTERNALMTDVYPQLKAFCKRLGYEFQIVDMRWGVRGEAEDDHRTTDICLRELEECQKLSTGPNFVTFLSHKYGYQPIPRVIESREFETIIKSLNEEEKLFLLKWYRRDDNLIPAAHILQPITRILPDYLSADEKLRSAAKSQWWHTFEKLRGSILQGVDQNITDAQRRHKYHQSVTEDEIAHGILNRDKSTVKKTCFWFKRNVMDIELEAKKSAPEEDKKVQYYYDGVKNPEAALLLPNLKDKKIPQILDSASVKEYNIPWYPSGIETKHPEHRKYIEELCQDFKKEMENMIMKGISEREKEEMNDSLYFEIVQHVNFSRAKSSQFCGREDILEEIKNYIKGPNQAPLILHGDSGSGKTSIVAMAANLAFDWLDGKCAVVYRFLGTTQSSSSLRPLMHSLVEQLFRLYVSWKSIPRTDLKDLMQDFKDVLRRPKEDKPLVLFLDSLDQLDDMDSGRNLHWLPRSLPPHVKIVMSCVPQKQYKVFDKLKGLYPGVNCYKEIVPMKLNEIDLLLNNWLTTALRTLTKSQKDHLTAAFALCPVPLFYQLSFDEALRWHSWDDVSAIKDSLQVTVADTIDALFDRVEKSHGRLLVSFALGCLTAAKSGLSGGEIEDLLSLNDQVLNDVYQFWEPPVRRLPPLLWVRVRHDLQEYMVTRGVDGVRVITWYYRQFRETAYRKYLGNEEIFKQIHAAMAEYFLGKWSEKPKPYTDKDGGEKWAFRGIAKEPLQYSTGAFNLRKVNQLPFHLTNSGDLSLLKQEVIFNNQFILGKLTAAGFSALLEDITVACREFPNDKEISLLKETLQLSQDALLSNPNELASQLVGRIHGTGSKDIIKEAEAMLDAGTLPPEAVEVLNLLQSFEAQHNLRNKNIQLMLTKVQESDDLVLLPHRGFLAPPGGQLLHKLGGHTDIVVDMDLTSDEKTIASGSLDKTAKIWNVASGDLVHSVDLPSEVGFIRFCNRDRWIVISCANRTVFILDVSNGALLQQLQAKSDENDLPELCMPIAICQNAQHEETLICLRNTCLDVWKLSNGERIATLKHHLDDWSVHHQGAYMRYRHLVGHGNTFVYASYRGTEFYTGCLSDMEEEDPLNMVEVFEAYDFDKGKEDTDFTPRNMDHICAMAITGDGERLLLCNGKDVKLHLYDIESGNKQLLIDFKGNARMRACNFVLGSDLFYFCNKTSVGVMNVTSQAAHSILAHPCKVVKVLGTKGPHVVTIAVDDIVRVWDQSMEPYQINLSEFTGKVKVKSSNDYNQTFSSFSSLFQSITGKNVAGIDASEILTTEDVENYWTKEVKTDEFEEMISSKAITTFLPMLNQGYVAVVQTNPINQTAFCFSIWESMQMTCVKRLFFPQDSVYVFMVYQDKSLLLAENGVMKLYDLNGNNVWKTFEGKLCVKHKPTAVYNHLRNEIVTESEDDLHLVVYDISKGSIRGTLETPGDAHSHYKESKKALKSRFSEIKIDRSGKILAARVSNERLLVWDLEDLNLKTVVNMKDPRYELPYIKDCSYAFELTPSGGHLVLTRDNIKVYGDAKDTTTRTSVVFIDVNTGTLVGHASPYAKNQQHSMIVKHPVAFVRQFRRPYLQIVGIGHDGKCYTIAEQKCGRYTSEVKTNHSFSRFVTWCPRPREKTVKLWSYENNNLVFLASFTPDKEVTDVGVSENGRSLFINSDSGVIKLRVAGKGASVQDPQDQVNAEVLYDSKELDATYELGQEQITKEDQATLN